MGQNLVTRQEYKAYTNITNPNHDQEIDNLIPKVSEFVKTYCKRTFVDFVDENKVETFNGASGILMLKESPVLSVNSVEYSTDYGQTHIELKEYIDWVEDEGYIVSINPSGFPRQLRGYRVMYTAGYEQLPEDLKLGVMDLITYYRKNDMAVHSTKAPGTNAVQIEYITTTGLPAHIRRVLDFYRSDFA
jgi:hypothetical protein